MREWYNVKGKKCLLLIALTALFFQSIRAYAVECKYIATEYVREAGITIQFPEEILSVTQNSLPTDDFFQVYGIDLYDPIMEQLKEDAVYLDTINADATWELRVTVNENIGMNLKDISQYDAEGIAQWLGDELEKKGITVQETYAIMHPYSAILIIHCVMQNRNFFMCITNTENKTITITVGDIYSGSITVKELESLANSIAEGIIFEEGDFTSIEKNEHPKEQNVTIEEIGVSFELPAEIKWATRSKGDKEFIIEQYSLDADSFISYFEDNEYYFISIDPNSSFRFDLIKTLAKADVKNSVLLSDQELASDLNSQEYADMLSLFNCIDKWVWRDEKNAVTCLLMEMEDMKQYVLSASTAINGYFYIFSMRDTDAEHLRDISEYIFSTFSVAQNSGCELVNLSLIDKQLQLPANLTITDQNTEFVEGVGMSDNILIETYASDGTRRAAMITIMDFSSLVLENATKVEREAFDRILGEEMLSTIFQSQGLHEISTLECNDIDFKVFRIDETQTTAAMIGCALGYIIQIEWSVPLGDALTDEVVPTLHEVACDIVQAIKE